MIRRRKPCAFALSVTKSVNGTSAWFRRLGEPGRGIGALGDRCRTMRVYDARTPFIVAAIARRALGPVL